MMNDAQIRSLLSLAQAIQGLAATAEQILAEAAGLVAEEPEPDPMPAPKPTYLGE